MGRSTRTAVGTPATMVACPLLTLLLMCASAAAREPDDSRAQERASAQRLEVMRELVQQFSAQPLDDAARADLTLRDEPIMRYNDPARNLMDGSVWRVGETGRPHALITVELISQQDRYMASYEFLAVEPPAFRGRFRQFIWQPPQAFAEFQPIPEVPSPSATARGRLTQMKQLARRFAAYQRLGQDKYTLRMLPQPVDRYQPSDEDAADGAAFAFTYGVNPEVLLLIETDGSRWQFACLRLSVARLMVDLDGEEAWNARGTGSREYQNGGEVYTQSRQYLPADTLQTD